MFNALGCLCNWPHFWKFIVLWSLWWIYMVLGGRKVALSFLVLHLLMDWLFSWFMFSCLLLFGSSLLMGDFGHFTLCWFLWFCSHGSWWKCFICFWSFYHFFEFSPLALVLCWFGLLLFSCSLHYLLLYFVFHLPAGVGILYYMAQNFEAFV